MIEPDRHCGHCGRPKEENGQVCTNCGMAPPLTRPHDGAAGERQEVPWTPAHVAAGLLAFLALLIAAAFVARAVGSLYPAHEMALQTWVGVHLLAVCAGVVVWFLGVRSSTSPGRVLGLTMPRTSLGLTVALAAGALAASILGTFAYGLAVDSLGMESLRPPEVEDATIFPGIGILLTMQALAAVTPLSEEVLFRGFVLRGLLPSIGAGPAVVATALLFSVLHLEPRVMIPIFVTGVALGLLYVRTGSLWPCIAAHAGQNALALLSVRFL